MQSQLLQPGDATRYIVAYDIIQDSPEDMPSLFFAFGTGVYSGSYLIMSLEQGFQRHMSYGYFASYFREQSYHTTHVAFEVFSHIYGNHIDPEDHWQRADDFEEGWLSGLLTAAQLLEARNGS